MSQKPNKAKLSLSDILREEVALLPEHEIVRVRSLVEHIITLCQHHGSTGEISLGIITALVAEEAKGKWNE